MVEAAGAVREPGAVSRRGVIGGVASVFALVSAAALASCAQQKPKPVPSDDNAQAAVTVRVADNVFDPAEVTVEPNQAVRWEFSGSAKHDVVANDRSFVSELMREGSYTHVFDAAGEFNYICSIHAEMRGVVRVARPST